MATDKLTTLSNRLREVKDKFDALKNSRKCKRKIGKLEVRGVVRGDIYQGYICEECSREYLADMPRRLKMMINKINKLSNMSVEEKRVYLKKLKIIEELEK